MSTDKDLVRRLLEDADGIEMTADERHFPAHFLERAIRYEENAREAADRIEALTSELAEREKELAAQIAGHAETARQSTENLMRANTAQAKIDEAEARSRKHWQMFRDLREAIIGTGPMCRDCADEDGRCPYSKRPCDPDAAAAEQIVEWKAAEARIKALEDALTTAGYDAASVNSIARSAFEEGRNSMFGTDRHYSERAWENSHAKAQCDARAAATLGGEKQ